MNCTTESPDEQKLRIDYAEDDFSENIQLKYNFYDLIFDADKAYCPDFLHLG